MNKTKLSGKACQVKINTATIRNLLSSFVPGTNFQKFIDLEIIRLSDPYVPSDTASIRKSVFTSTTFGSGEIVYKIFGNLNGRNTWNDDVSRFQDAPRRGPEWAIRMLNGGGKEKLELAARRFIKQKGL